MTAAESVDRWIIDTANANGVNRLDVVHDLDQADLAVVRGTEDDVKDVTNKYANDLFYQLEPPAHGDLDEHLGLVVGGWRQAGARSGSQHDGLHGYRSGAAVNVVSGAGRR